MSRSRRRGGYGSRQCSARATDPRLKRNLDVPRTTHDAWRGVLNAAPPVPTATITGVPRACMSYGDDDGSRAVWRGRKKRGPRWSRLELEGGHRRHPPHRRSPPGSRI